MRIDAAVRMGWLDGRTRRSPKPTSRLFRSGRVRRPAWSFVFPRDACSGTVRLRLACSVIPGSSERTQVPTQTRLCQMNLTYVSLSA